MSITFHMPPWSAIQLMWELCYFSFLTEIFLADFTSFLGKRYPEGKKYGTICQKYKFTANKITQPPPKLHILIRWHMKDNGYSYLFQKRFRSWISARLDQIRIQECVTPFPLFNISLPETKCSYLAYLERISKSKAKAGQLTQNLFCPSVPNTQSLNLRNEGKLQCTVNTQVPNLRTASWKSTKK